MPNLYPNDPTQQPTLYNDPETFDDPIRRVGADATTTFDNSRSTPTEWAGSEALDIAPGIDDPSLQLRTVGGEEEDVVEEDDEDDDEEDEADEEDLDLSYPDALDTSDARVFKRDSISPMI